VEGDPLVDPWAALRLSAVVAAAATALGLPPALGLGYVLARKSFPGKALLSALLLAPMVLPPVVTGLLLLRLFGRGGPLGPLLQALGLEISFSLAGAVLAALAVGFPLHVLGARSAIEAVDPRHEQLAMTLGDPPLRAIGRVTLPLALPGLGAATVLAFARALGEFGATAVLAGNIEGRTRTLALAVYTLLESPGGEAEVRALVGASLGLSLLALLGYEALQRWQRRRLGLDGG
jgi:molybdate transport system permease protein